VASRAGDALVVGPHQVTRRGIDAPDRPPTVRSGRRARRPAAATPRPRWSRCSRTRQRSRPRRRTRLQMRWACGWGACQVPGGVRGRWRRRSQSVHAAATHDGRDACLPGSAVVGRAALHASLSPRLCCGCRPPCAPHPTPPTTRRPPARPPGSRRSRHRPSRSGSCSQTANSSSRLRAVAVAPARRGSRLSCAAGCGVARSGGGRSASGGRSTPGDSAGHRCARSPANSPLRTPRSPPCCSHAPSEVEPVQPHQTAEPPKATDAPADEVGLPAVGVGVRVVCNPW